MLNKLLPLLFLVGCTYSERPAVSNRNYAVDKKMCVQVCVAEEFKNFHGTGKSWGTGSSSMNGLAQQDIYKIVYEKCEQFYKDVNCCEWNNQYTTENNIYTNHGWEFGQCRIK